MSRSETQYGDWLVNIAALLLWFCLAYACVRAAGELIFGTLFRKRKGYEAPLLARNIFSLLANITLFALIFKLIFVDVPLGPLFTGSALLGIILGLALQDTLGNLFAGISLHADKPFQVGDVITVGPWSGVVESITWRAVKIRTFANRIVLVSNSVIAKESIEVAPRKNLNARLVHFNALYTDSPVKVIHAVREAIREAENVSRKITPIVRIRGLGDSGVDYEIKYWLEDYARYNDTDALLRQRVWYAYRRAGLNFAYPTRTLHVERKRAAQEDGQRDGTGFLDRLSAVDIFAPLSAEELGRLAASSESHVFAPGEKIIRIGEAGSSMFVIHRGRVEVRIKENGQQRTVATLGEGDFFGEMALFTGEPRTANVFATEETEVLEVGHQAMKHLFATNPDLAEAFSLIIAERRAGLAAKPEEAAAAQDQSAGLLSAIKRFFHLD